MISFYLGLVTFAFVKQNLIAIILSIIISIPLLFILLFGIYTLIIFLFLNARKVWQKEGHALPNMLTLILALGLTALLIVEHLPIDYPIIIRDLIVASKLILFYLGFVFLDYLTVNLLYQLNHPSLDQDFVVVLGAGLINGERVTPLLASRVDRGIQFFKRQLEKTNNPPFLLMSGGKGSDEKISEAEAMRNYALEQGVPPEYILIETASTTTLENMKFSKKIIDEKKKNAKVIFASSNYHIFRASLFAKEAQLKADGIPSKTAFYYLPNAFLREFAAILVKKKKKHSFVIGSIILVSLLLALLEWFLVKIGAVGPV